jgi:hypothetical protein
LPTHQQQQQQQQQQLASPQAIITQQQTLQDLQQLLQQEAELRQLQQEDEEQVGTTITQLHWRYLVGSSLFRPQQRTVLRLSLCYCRHNWLKF